MTKYVNGLDGLSRLFARLAVEEKVVVDEAMGATAAIVKHHVKKNFGDRERLAELSQWTQDERTEMGYSPDEPLLRDGSLLRDKVESEHLGPVAGVGTPEIINLYHELGYVNHLTGNSVPPRPVFRLAVGDSKEEVITVFEDALSFIFTGRAMRFLASEAEE